jgi:hypothetical protein
MIGKRIWSWAVALGLLMGLAAGVQARVTEKVEGMIAENSPIKIKDNDWWIQIGGPLMYGVQFDKYASANFALGMGVGSYLEGTSVDMSVKWYWFAGKLSPFLVAGPAWYYTSPEKNFFAGFGGAGLSYFFDNGLGFSFACIYTKAVTQASQHFSYYFISDEMAWTSAQFGLHWNF